MKLAIVFISALAIGGHARPNTGYLVNQVNNYRQASASLLNNAMRLAKTDVSQLAINLRQAGSSKVEESVVWNYLLGNTTPSPLRVNEFNTALAEIIDADQTIPLATKTETLATLDTLFKELREMLVTHNKVYNVDSYQEDVATDNFLQKIGDYNLSSNALLSKAMEVSGISSNKLLVNIRKEGENISKFAMPRLLRGENIAKNEKYLQLQKGFERIVSTELTAEKAQTITKELDKIFSEMFEVALPLERFVRDNKQAFSVELQPGVAKVVASRMQAAVDYAEQHALSNAEKHSSSMATARDKGYMATSYGTDLDTKGFLQIIDDYDLSSIALLLRATEVSEISFYKLLNSMRSDGEVIGKHTIPRILKGERIATDERYLQLQAGLVKIVTDELPVQQAQTIIEDLKIIFNQMISVALPLERYVRDNKQVPIELHAGVAKVKESRAQAVTDHQQRWATK